MKRHVPGTPTSVADNRRGARGASGVPTIPESGGTTLVCGTWSTPAVHHRDGGFCDTADDMGAVGSAGRAGAPPGLV